MFTEFARIFLKNLLLFSEGTRTLGVHTPSRYKVGTKTYIYSGCNPSYPFILGHL